MALLFAFTVMRLEAKRLSYILSVECKKVVSAFLSFCGKSNFVFRFPMYFIIFLTSRFVHKNAN